MHPTPTPPVPDSPDALIRLWADAPAPLSRADTEPPPPPDPPRDANRRPHGWDRLTRRPDATPRALYAAFARAQTRASLAPESRRRREVRRMRRALRLGHSPATGRPYHPRTLARYARELRPREEAAYPSGAVAAAYADAWASLDRQRAARLREGLTWYRDRWLPTDADAAARLRELGLA